MEAKTITWLKCNKSLISLLFTEEKCWVPLGICLLNIFDAITDIILGDFHYVDPQHPAESPFFSFSHFLIPIIRIWIGNFTSKLLHHIWLEEFMKTHIMSLWWVSDNFTATTRITCHFWQQLHAGSIKSPSIGQWKWSMEHRIPDLSFLEEFISFTHKEKKVATREQSC